MQVVVLRHSLQLALHFRTVVVVAFRVVDVAVRLVVEKVLVLVGVVAPCVVEA